MNSQKHGGIPYCDYTWNPLTGCKHGCTYCYARPLAERMYREGFEPTLWKERLVQPQRVKTAQRVFVCDMGDLFGEWVSASYIQCILEACRAAPWHTYLFLTKNPSRYWSIPDEWFPPHSWLGATIDHPSIEARKLGALTVAMSKHEDRISWVSYEPLLGEMSMFPHQVDWAVIGERTVPSCARRKNGVARELRELSDAGLREVCAWAEPLISRCRELRVPVFVKNRLAEFFPYRELPDKDNLEQARLFTFARD